MAAKHTLTDPMPTTHEAVREEIKYWQDRFNTGGLGSTLEGPVRKRLEALYALDRASAQKIPEPPPSTEGRVRLSVRLLLQSLAWLGLTITAIIFRRKRKQP